MREGGCHLAALTGITFMDPQVIGDNAPSRATGMAPPQLYPY
jgi:hypothetical protein